jgi:hypothetical protein
MTACRRSYRGLVVHGPPGWLGNSQPIRLTPTHASMIPPQADARMWLLPALLPGEEAAGYAAAGGGDDEDGDEGEVRVALICRALPVLSAPHQPSLQLHVRQRHMCVPLSTV